MAEVSPYATRALDFGFDVENEAMPRQYYAVDLRDGRFAVFLVHRDSREWWRLVAIFSTWERADRYATVENDCTEFIDEERPKDAGYAALWDQENLPAPASLPEETPSALRSRDEIIASVTHAAAPDQPPERASDRDNPRINPEVTMPATPEAEAAGEDAAASPTEAPSSPPNPPEPGTAASPNDTDAVADSEPSRESEAIALAERGISRAEIARQMGLTKNQVSGTLDRAIKAGRWHQPSLPATPSGGYSMFSGEVAACTRALQKGRE